MGRVKAPASAVLAIGVGIGLLLASAATASLPSVPATAVEFDAPSIRLNTLISPLASPFLPVPDEPSTSEPVLITLEFGLTASDIAKRLADAGLLEDPELFCALALERGIDRSLRSGSYRLVPNTPASDILDFLTVSVRPTH